MIVRVAVRAVRLEVTSLDAFGGRPKPVAQRRCGLVAKHGSVPHGHPTAQRQRLAAVDTSPDPGLAASLHTESSTAASLMLTA